MRTNVAWTSVVGMLCLLPTSHQPAFAQGQTGSCGLGKKAVKPLMETHTLSPYPVDSVKNDEEGTVMIEVRLGADGVPTQVNVKTSSGFPRLDEQTRKWVLDHWRWQPPGGNCSATTLVNYRWSLADADTHSPPSPQYDGNAITRALLGNH